MKDKLEYLVFIFFVVLVRILPESKLYGFASSLSKFLFKVVPIRKEVVVKNLQSAFPEKSRDEILNITFENYRSFIITFLEILRLPRFTEKKITASVKFENKNMMREIIDSGSGFMIMTAHFGNWELGAVAFGVEFNKPVNVIVKTQRNPYVTKWLNNMRESFGNNVVPLGMSIRQIYSLLKNKEPIGVVGDQRGPREGKRIKYFGIDTAVYHGSVELALKTGTPIVCTFTERQKDNTYRAVLEKLDLSNLPDSEEGKIETVMQRYMNLLEVYVRRSPEQWFWMHNIWKY